MDTPICDFAKKYAESDVLRLHMPGHKGKAFIGCEHRDLTEISGADSLYEAEGIIAESEKNASRLFGCETFYSTEGSSQCIRAMLYLICIYAKSKGEKPWILAGRNAHKTFLSAAALLDFDTEWIYPKKTESYLSCNINADELEKLICNAAEKPTAVYITNPDYLGNIVDIRKISAVCKKHGVILAVDNAHGAYLRFLPDSFHPIDLGADICCDSAHKTLPVLTGGAYLHISDSAPQIFKNQGKNALAFFGSTSPSYLIMQSLDNANNYIDSGYPQKLSSCIRSVNNLKEKLSLHGYSFVGNEPLKLTFNIKKYGYTGTEFADILAKSRIICEFADPDFVVFMFTPEITNDEFNYIYNTLISVNRKKAINESPPVFVACKKAMTIKDASFSLCETLKISNCIGRTLARSNVGCPPAVPIVMCGEIIDSHAVSCFEYYGIKECTVVK